MGALASRSVSQVQFRPIQALLRLSSAAAKQVHTHYTAGWYYLSEDTRHRPVFPYRNCRNGYSPYSRTSLHSTRHYHQRKGCKQLRSNPAVWRGLQKLNLPLLTGITLHTPAQLLFPGLSSPAAAPCRLCVLITPSTDSILENDTARSVTIPAAHPLCIRPGRLHIPILLTRRPEYTTPE